MDFNNIETIKNLLGQGISANAGNPDDKGESHPPRQATPCEFGRKETIEEEMHYKRPALEPLDE